jgi:hypothetical protein
MNRPLRMPWEGAAKGAIGAALACVALLIVPLRRRTWLALMGWMAIFATFAGMGCGGGGNSGGGGGGQSNPGTTPGTYTVTITGVSSGMTETGTVALMVQ